MSSRTIYLISFRQSPSMRAHFSIFVPLIADPECGTLIHVVGVPMASFHLEFKRNYKPAETSQLYTKIPIGSVFDVNIVDSVNSTSSKDDKPQGNLELAAAQVPAPRKSENFLAPVNDTTNRRCQEWTMDYIRRLVQLNYIDSSAIATAQAHRDPPNHGIGLRAVAGDRGRGGQMGGFGVAGPAYQTRANQAQGYQAQGYQAQGYRAQGYQPQRYQAPYQAQGYQATVVQAPYQVAANQAAGYQQPPAGQATATATGAGATPQEWNEQAQRWQYWDGYKWVLQ